ncbi:MAG: OmpA family protein [Candidatus Nanoarchaeia archaeon]
MINSYLKFSFIFLLFFTFFTFGCSTLQTNTEKGTAVGSGTGAGVGAILGQAIGKNTESTLIGAGAGAIVGGIAGNKIGKYMDKQEQELASVVQNSQAANLKREQDLLQTTFKSDVMFKTDSSNINQGGITELSRVADILKKYNKTNIRVEGHTDKTGEEDYNLKLSEKRAKAVKKVLIQNGVNKERITTIGLGESQPTSEEDSQNRRVEIFIMPIKKG